MIHATIQASDFPSLALCIGLATAMMSLVGWGFSQCCRNPSVQRGVLIATLGVSLLAPLPILIASITGTGLAIDVEAIANPRPAAPIAIPDAVPHEPMEASQLDVDAEPSGTPTPVETVNQSPLEPGEDTRIDAAGLTLTAWGIGSVFTFLMASLGFVRLRRIWTRQTEVTDRRTLRIARSAQQRSGLAWLPAIYASSAVRTPMLLGWYRPGVFLPEDLDAELGDEELCSVLVHEFTHITQNDQWVALLRTASSIAFWWNPLTYFITRDLDRLSEFGCDDRAAAVHQDAADYARMLKTLAEDASWQPALPMPALLRKRSHPLVARVARLLERDFTPMPKPSRMSKFTLTAFSAGLLSIGFITPEVNETAPNDQSTAKSVTTPSAPPQGKAAKRPAALEVRVVWSDGQPAAGIAVEVFELEGPNHTIAARRVTTGPDGYARIDRLRPGYARVRCVRGGDFLLRLNAERRSAVRMQIAGGVDIRGRVVDSTGQPIADAQIFGLRPRSSTGRPGMSTCFTRTDATGRFTVRDVPPRTKIICLANGFAASKRKTIATPLGQNQQEVVGTVSAVSASGKLITFQISGDGAFLAAGTELSVFNGKKYKGEVVITELHSSRKFAFGRMVLQSTNPPTEGDKVSKQLGDSRPDFNFRLERSSANLRVVVTDSDGKPIPHAEVRIGDDGVPQQTSEDGVMMSPVRAGRVILHVRAAGFSPFTRELIATHNATRIVHIKLSPGVEVNGMVRRPDGQPAAGAIVRLGPSKKSGEARTRTDENGRFRLESLPPGDFKIQVSDQSHNWHEHALQGKDGQRLECEIKLAAPTKLHGHVVDGRGQPVPKAQVIVRPQGPGDWVQTGRTGPDGRFNVPLNSKGGVQVSIKLGKDHGPVVHREGVHPSTKPLIVVIDPKTHREAKIRGRFVDPNGRPATGGATVELSSEAGSNQPVTVGADGRFEASRLPPGKYQLLYKAPGLRSWKLAIEMTDGQQLDVGVVRLRTIR